MRCLLFALAATGSYASKVVQIGDSWEYYSQNTLPTFCAGATTHNRGVAGSTAKQWIEGAASCPTGDPTGSCNAPAAFAGQTDITHIQITIGGNDYIDDATGACGKSRSAMTTLITNMIDVVRKAAVAASAVAPGFQIVLAEYCSPTAKPAPTCGVANFGVLNGAIADAAAAALDVTTIGGGDACGGSVSTFSPGQHHIDPLHLNHSGYCHVWTTPVAQSALGCGAGFYDCDNYRGPLQMPFPPPPATPPPAAPPPLPPPSPSPSMPSPAPGVAVFKVTASFTLGGSVSDYGKAAQTSIKATIAADAGVSTSAVNLTLTAGSVIVAADIFVASQAEADAKVTKLAAGVLKDAAALETALTAQFVKDGVATTALKVEALTAPQAASTSDGGSNVGAIVGGVVGGCFVPVLMLILWLSGAFAKHGCASPFAKKEGAKFNGAEMTAQGAA